MRCGCTKVQYTMLPTSRPPSFRLEMHRPCDCSSCTTLPICLLYNLGTGRKSDGSSNEMLAPNSYPQYSEPSISVGGHTRDALHGPLNLNAVTLCSRDCGPVPRGMSLSGVGFLLSGVGGASRSIISYAIGISPQGCPDSGVVLPQAIKCASSCLRRPRVTCTRSKTSATC
jgi:hypothetical protein